MSSTTADPLNDSPGVESLRLPGLDGSNPLGFLAALGLLSVVDYRARRVASQLPRISWVDDGYWQPELHTTGDLDFVIDQTIEDKLTWANDPALLLAYDETGEQLVDPRMSGTRATRDLKPKPVAMREFLLRIATAGEVADSSRQECLAARRSMDHASAYGSEIVQDNNGNTKPLALHFTAGQQRFLDAVAKLQQGVGGDDLREALIGPWKRTSKLPSMSWDSTVARLYALRATDPSSEKRGSTPGADWLAFVALSLFLASPRGRRLETTCVRGRWKSSTFSWPLWESPASLPIVRSLLGTQQLTDMPASARTARGIAIVFSSAITR